MLILGSTNDNANDASDNFGVKYPAAAGWKDITLNYDSKTTV